MSEKKEKIYNKKYTKVKKIGGGSFGSVYIVKEITDNKIFAMKKFYMDNLGNGGAKRQYNLLKEFLHENIIKVIEMFEEYGNQYLITEYHPYNLLDLLTKKERLYDLKSSALSEEVSKEEIAQTTDSIYEDWNNKSKTLSFYLEHDELEKVHTQMRRVIAYFEVDSKEDAIPEIEEGIYTLEHLKDKRELTWKNVF